MDSFWSHLMTAGALVLVIEGLLYAVFPSHIQNVMDMASKMPKEKFRLFGMSMLALGVLLVWLTQKF